MFCRQCGKKIADDLSFCPSCGYVPAPPVRKQASGNRRKKIPHGFRTGLVCIGLILALGYLYIFLNKPAKQENPSIVSAEEYSKIEKGMSYKQVMELIGSPGSEADRWNDGSFEIVIVEWQGANSGTSVSVKFQNGTVIDKLQHGLAS